MLNAVEISNGDFRGILEEIKCQSIVTSNLISNNKKENEILKEIYDLQVNALAYLTQLSEKLGNLNRKYARNCD